MHEQRKKTLLDMLINHPTRWNVIREALDQAIKNRITEHTKQAFLSSTIAELEEMVQIVDTVMSKNKEIPNEKKTDTTSNIPTQLPNGGDTGKISASPTSTSTGAKKSSAKPKHSVQSK